MSDIEQALIKSLRVLNTWLETPPFSFIFHGIFWSITLIIIAPLVGLGHAIYTIYQLIQYLNSIGSKENDNIINATHSKNKLGVLITGCDSGFGHDATIELSKRGYTIFAGCYSNDNISQFNGMDNIISFKMDVTSERDVNSAFGKVSSWLSETDDRPRVLHGLINNAGTGALGFVDWNDLSVFRDNMEVNYFAMIRVTKTFLPILKAQACNGTYTKSRIINMVSVAGLVPLSGPYSGSKYAAEAFSNILRQELKSFDISVVTMNPTFHKTPMVDGLVSHFDSKIECLDSDLKKQYGDELFNFERGTRARTKYITWDIDNVIRSIVTCIEAVKPPPQALVGTDAKYLFMVLRMLPIWFIDRFTPFCKAAGVTKNEVKKD